MPENQLSETTQFRGKKAKFVIETQLEALKIQIKDEQSNNIYIAYELIY